MKEHDERQGHPGQEASGESLDNTLLARRQFLKLAAVAAGAIGVGGGLGAVLGGCGQEAGTTTSAAAGSGTTLGTSSTNVTAGPEIGRPIKLGYVVPITGPLAPMASGSNWAVKHFMDAIGDGLTCGDKKRHSFEVLIRDAQSDSNRAAQITGDLIQNDKVDVLLSQGTPLVVTPSADVAEAMGCPSISVNSEWHTFTMDRKVPPQGFKWTYGFMFDQVRVALDNIGTFDLLPANKKIALICPNDVDGNAFAALGPPAMTQAGYDVTVSQFTPGDEDYTAHFAKFKKAGCELVSAAMVAPDFANFWTQALQQSFRPKVVCVNRGLTFPEAVIALGERAHNLCSDGAWTPRGTFKDSLTGMTQRQLADEYEALTGSMWSENIMMLVKFEWVADVFRRVTDIEDKEGIASAIGSTKLDCCFGPTLDFTVPVQEDSYHPQVNVTVAPHAECQWVKTTGGKWPVEKVVVYPLDPNLLETEAEIQPLLYG